MENNEDVLYLKKNQFSLQSFAQSQVPAREVPTFINSLWCEPSFTRTILQNWKMDNFEKIETFYENTIRLSSFLGVIIAGKGSGKTATAYKAAYEFWLEGYPIEVQDEIDALMWSDLYDLVIEKFGKSKNKVFIFAVFDVPPFIETTYDLFTIPEDSFLIIDEGAIFNSSRNSGSSGGTSGILILLPILRHQNLKIIIISQDDMMIDKMFFRTLDFKIFKNLGDEYSNERGILSDLDLKMIDLLEDKSYLFFKNGTTIMTLSLELCPNYEKYSKSFKKLKLPAQEDIAINLTKVLMDNTESTDKEIKQLLGIFGYVKKLDYYKKFREENI